MNNLEKSGVIAAFKDETVSRNTRQLQVEVKKWHSKKSEVRFLITV